MLQRQQASAIIDAKRAIVDGAGGMVEMALNRLSENNIVQLDELEKKWLIIVLLRFVQTKKPSRLLKTIWFKERISNNYKKRPSTLLAEGSF